MPDKIVNHFVLADGSVARYDYESLAGIEPVEAKLDYIFSETPSNISLTWEQGYVNASGGNGSGNDSCRTSFMQLAGEVVVSLDTDIMCSVYEYSTSDVSGFVERILYRKENSFDFIAKKGAFYRFSISKTDFSQLLVSDVTATTVSANVYVSLDVDKTANIDESVISAKAWDYRIALEQGFWGDKVATKENSEYRVRSTNLVPVNRTIQFFHLPDDIVILIYEYDKELNFVRESGSYLAFPAGEDHFYCFEGDYAVFVFKSVQDSVKIKPSDIGNFYLTDYMDIPRKSVYMHTLPTLFEKGQLSSGGYSNNFSNKTQRTAYMIKTNGAKYASIELPDDMDITALYVLAYYYDSNMDYLSYEEHRLVIPYYRTNIPWFEMASNVSYVKFVVYTTTRLGIIDVNFYGSAVAPEFCKNKQFKTPCEAIPFEVTNDMYTTSRLMLPPNYSADGEPVPLVLWMDGSGNFTRWDADISAVKIPYLEYVRDEGFAVFSVFAWGHQYIEKYPACGNAFPYPIPTNLACIKKGLEYICDRFNIDANNVHVMSKSQGGQCATYFVTNPIWDFKSIGMFSPVNDYLSMPGEAMYADTRKAIAEDLGFTGDTTYFGSDNFLAYSTEGRAFFQNNIEMLAGMNEAWTGLVGADLQTNFDNAMDDCATFWGNTSATDIYTHGDYVKIGKIPVKIWGARDDTATPYLKMVEIVKQWQNGGTEAHLVTFPNGTGGHSAPDVGANKVASITTVLGITHTDVPTGWVENVEWMRQKMPK